jgi:putative FmdB family regulatory protein
MPIYDYKCVSCGVVTEKIVNSYKIENIECPKCGCSAEKQLSDTFKFELKYDPKRDRVSWGYDNYNTTRRYEEYDKLAKKNSMIQVPK